ncbi:DUF998 domain-containing protein [Microbispora triticiradicis]|uniref:DUF998 domain-containing protein n=1 Tax=Microbispora triticiradicis TaxID=2200763 RepID=UPI001AD7E553|nr:DUF998 domain-containing protein [Microbispora triticiradicis]MBO4269753.1 DUF998 domain-containing protein [Microbispora triticiradicis]
MTSTRVTTSDSGSRTAGTLPASASSGRATRTGAAAPASTRTLLACGVAAAPVFGIVSLAQAFTRADFDLLRHPLSMLSTGDLGWLQISNFLVTAALTVAGAAGLRRVMRGVPGVTWAPRLMLVQGLMMAASGVFVLDPGDGFPAGTPAGPGTMSWHGLLHLASGSVAFAALAAACFVLGRHYSRAGRSGHAFASRLGGLAVVLGNGWAMSGGRAGSLTLCVGVLAAMAWLSVVVATERAALAG